MTLLRLLLGLTINIGIANSLNSTQAVLGCLIY